MKRSPFVICSLSVLLFGTAVLAQVPAGEMDAHIATAKTAAGQDYRGTFVNLCLPAGAPAGGGGRRTGGRGGGGGGGGAAQTPDRANWYAPPFKVFDNLYWLGTRQHSSWALQTNAGIIIIDTNFAWATEPEIIDGLTKLGLNPRDIKYVIISHAHGDHDQGAAELQKRYGAKVVMGAPDWDATLQRPATAAGGVPTRDVSVGPEGTKLTLGDTTVQIVANKSPSATDIYLLPIA
jgi:metallo-beta-lactamase class B